MVTFASTGNFFRFWRFGYSSWARCGGASNSTRGVFLGGGTPSKSNVIQYITFAESSNATDFGDLSYTADAQIEGVCGSPIRGIAAGGNTGSKINNISYINISTTGNAQDFGDLTLARGTAGSASNATRGIFAGGEPNTNIIDFITIASTGNAQDFGDLQTASFSMRWSFFTNSCLFWWWGITESYQYYRLYRNSYYRKCIRLW